MEMSVCFISTDYKCTLLPSITGKTISLSTYREENKQFRRLISYRCLGKLRTENEIELSHIDK